MAKLTLSSVANLQNEQTAVGTINTNSTAIETALENTLSRDGTSPNEMNADLDMNGFVILNLPTPADPTDVVRLQDLEDALDDANLIGPEGPPGPVGPPGQDGEMTGPNTSTDNAVARYDGTDGTTVQDSGVVIDDSNNVSGIVTIELGHASDTTLSRASAGQLAVEGVAVAMNSTTSTHTAQTIELGHASDTTLSRDSAGVIAIEGVTVPLNSITSTHTAQTIELGHASDTTLSRASSGVLAVEGVNVLTTGTGIAQGKHTVWIPATGMIPRTTNGAAAGSYEMSTNKQMLKTLDFDTTTQEFAQFAIHMPKGWNESTVTFQPVWSHASTTTNFGVVWALEAVALSDDDAADASWGTAQTSTDTGGTTNDIYIGPESSAITIGGTPAENDYVMFQVKRNVSDGSDTMAVDARLHGIKLFYTINASTDA
jgi:hypothetical protein